jgi:hypothetical protein
MGKFLEMVIQPSAAQTDSIGQFTRSKGRREEGLHDADSSLVSQGRQHAFDLGGGDIAQRPTSSIPLERRR